MKNLKLLFLVALMCGFALSSNAQSDSRSFETYWNLFVTCDGVVDKISGPVYGHVVDHYNPKTGVFEWYKFVFRSDELKSKRTGEIFSVSFYQRGTLIDDRYDTWHFNLRGDEGSHILVSVLWTLDVSTGTWTRTMTTKCM